MLELISQLANRIRAWKLHRQAQRLARRTLDRKIYCDDLTVRDRDGLLRLRAGTGQ